MKNNDSIHIANYCISFIDLLGQRLKYKDEGILPKFESPKDKAKFIDKIKHTVAPIDDLQRSSSQFLESSLDYKSPLRKELPPELHPVYDKMHEVKLRQQRWSDGLVYFVFLLEGNVECPMAGVYKLFVSTGCLCFLGLGKKQPLRGSIDIAWGVELHDGELYGAAVAKAYELESYVAQYPRIVVGQRALDYLITNIKNPASDIYSEFNRQLAQICLSILTLDSDGYHIVHYLGDSFKNFVSKGLHPKLYQEALKYLSEQCEKWHLEKNTKLSLRYNHLYSYFLAHSPDNPLEIDAQPAAARDGA
ncbi:MAG TPA: hypothetical protein ENN18_00305 [Proteobacteria bacterium]|nr:hypothetical protein [Pseudomonadota bacterium]